MSAIALPSRSLLDSWNHFWTKVRFKFVLPRLRQAKLEGVKLHIADLSPLMKNVILTGRYEFQERRFASMFLSTGDVVLELGGAIGFIGLYCRKIVGVKHVTSVEANPNTLKMLRQNYELNGLEPSVIHAAAAAQDGHLDLNIGGEFWENTLTGTSENTVRVPACSLATLIRRMPVSPTALICDIEGAEQYLDFSQLPESVDKIIMELHPGAIGEEATQAVLQKLTDCGFCESCRDGDVVCWWR
ncbi:methyltransferase, FkbM family [Prosthecobacter debontii]|uniref:Methyltransferase, FkbM family n=1 Tax=Prosthecobacter debontii TaxID=48467 RepID=A0A1T4XUL3_9BACT|nr:FkbM family methyltransferase [Prosthecobacter debontii]SKA93246.1 methyltransferase, FkbM family [Prosthecobacter debontii]